MVMQPEVKQRLYQLQSEVCRVLSHPKRLEIIDTLKGGEKSVHELLSILECSKANLSQHLVALRRMRIVDTRREGVSIFYRIVNPKVIEACHTVREMLLEQIMEDEKMSRLIIESTESE